MSGNPGMADRLRALSQASFPRFLLVGGSFALINAVLAAVLTAGLPLPAAASASIAWLLCIPPAWFCQRRFAFHRETARRGGGFFYFISQLIGVAISASAGALFARGEVSRDFVVYLLASVVAAVVSYSVARLVIFRAPRPAGPEEQT